MPESRQRPRPPPTLPSVRAAAEQLILAARWLVRAARLAVRAGGAPSARHRCRPTEPCLANQRHTPTGNPEPGPADRSPGTSVSHPVTGELPGQVVGSGRHEPAIRFERSSSVAARTDHRIRVLCRPDPSKNKIVHRVELAAGSIGWPGGFSLTQTSRVRMVRSRRGPGGGGRSGPSCRRRTRRARRGSSRSARRQPSPTRGLASPPRRRPIVGRDRPGPDPGKQ